MGSCMWSGISKKNVWFLEIIKREGWCEVTVVAVSMADNDNKGEIRERLIFGKWDEGNVRREKKRCGGRYTMGAFCVF